MRYLLRIMWLGLTLAGALVAYSVHQWYAPSVAQPTTLMIERGMGTQAILERLYAEKLIPAPWKILLPFAVNPSLRSLKAGEYELLAQMSPADIIGKIASGAVVVHKVTIPEGWTVSQIIAALQAEPLLTGAVPTPIAEGSLFPDTMHFVRNETRASLVARMQENARSVLEDAWARRAKNLPITTPQQALILASVVEKETGIPQERGRVAAVFSNRLRIGMRLQSDPTVAYGVAPGGMKRALTRGDLQRDTPYNSYTRDGLPPTPICNPGKAAIEAVLNPPKTDDLYFVATGHGGHTFSPTLRGHEENVRAYRAVRRAAKP